ncbi:nuclear transport factor 2 family protein [Micromonospora sp. WMMA2032]|nr:nuclear transport factor 2 family protein [Micromonospora sp. WMMA2032]
MAPNNGTLIREFVEAFNTRDADRLAPYLHPDVVFNWRR